MASSSVNKYLPDYVSPPGETLAEILEDQGMSQAELAERTGRTPKHINEVVKGRANITPALALQLERVLGVPASFWNNRQRQYDAYAAQMQEQRRLGEGAEWARLFPYKDMAKWGWVATTRDKLERIRNLLDFFGVVSPSVWETHWANIRVKYRISRSFRPDQYALAAWLRQGELVGNSIDCEPYDKDQFAECLSDIRSLTTTPPSEFPDKVVEQCASCGVAVAFVPELPKTASGATRWLSPIKALMQLSLRYKTDDQMWFTFFHEAAHILLHSKRSIFIEETNHDSEEDIKANRFATEFLIPPDRLGEITSQNTISKAAIRQFAQSLGIAPGIVVGQLQHKGLLPPSYCNDLKRKLIWVKQ